MNKITKIVKVEDTREFAYVEGKLKPIAGTGEARECSRCGRLHEVHAHVEIEDGSIAIVGTGCMGADSLAREARKLARRATTSKKRVTEEAERARIQAWRAKQVQIMKDHDAIFGAWLLEKTGIADRFRALQSFGGYSAARRAFEAETGHKRP